MSEVVWMAWLILAGICVIVETLTIGILAIWFGVGAGVAALMAYLGYPFIYQTIAFFITSIALLVIFTRYFAKSSDKIGEPERLAIIGKEAIVTKKIEPHSPGMVRLKSEDWMAVSNDGTVLPENTLVKVVGQQGVHLIVKRRD
jgi:membrane protein implicated in regulation of membrane protease activity